MEDKVLAENEEPPRNCYKIVRQRQYWVSKVLAHRKLDSGEEYMVQYKTGVKQWWGAHNFEAIQDLIDQFKAQNRTMREEAAMPVLEPEPQPSSSDCSTGPASPSPKSSGRKRSDPVEPEPGNGEVGSSPDQATSSKRKKLAVSKKVACEPTETDGKASSPVDPEPVHVKLEDGAKEIGRRVAEDVNSLVQAVASHQEENRLLKEKLEHLENQMKYYEKIVEEKAELGRELEQLKEKAEKEEVDAIKFWKELLGEDKHQDSDRVQDMKNKVVELVKWATGLKNYVHRNLMD